VSNFGIKNKRISEAFRRRRLARTLAKRLSRPRLQLQRAARRSFMILPQWMKLAMVREKYERRV
jgi:hypothetical protein